MKRKKTNENVNIFNKQELSPEATSQEVFQNKKNTSGYSGHILSYNSAADSVSKNWIQDSQADRWKKQ